MFRFQMRNFLLSSFLFFCIGCGKPLYQNLQPSPASSSCLDKLKPSFSSVLYTAHINAGSRHLSGLLLYKTMPDSSVRAVFTDEAGVKFFDFEYSVSGFKVISCISQLDKKIIIAQLKIDIGFPIMHGLNIPSAASLRFENENYFGFVSGQSQTYYITEPDCSRLLRIEYSSKRKKKIVVNFDGIKSGMPDSVNIAHQLFDFKIDLKQIEK